MTDFDADDPEPEHGQRSDGLAALSEADLRWLKACAKRLCVGDRIEPEELLYEALGRIVFGKRAWRPDLSLRGQVRSAMKSVLFAWRKARKRHPMLAWDDAKDSLALEDGDGAFAVGDDDYEARVQQQLAQLEVDFAEDPAARDLLEAVLLGFQGAELEEVTGLSTLQVAAARKRIARRLTKNAQKEE